MALLLDTTTQQAQRQATISLDYFSPNDTNDVSAYVDGPGHLDVLCGRGRGYFDHPGNRRMLAIIQQTKAEYQAAPKPDKPMITKRVVATILEPEDGTIIKFLKRSATKKGAPWYELSPEEVHKKVAHTLREQKSIVKRSKPTLLKRASSTATDTSDSGISLASAEAEAVPPASQRPEFPPIFDLAFLAAGAADPSVTITPVSSTVTVTDDENSHHPNNDDCSSQNASLLDKDDEPLSFRIEPQFGDVDLADIVHVRCVLEDVMDDINESDDQAYAMNDEEMAILGSFLDGVDLANSER